MAQAENGSPLGSFTFSTAGQVLFGAGRLSDLKAFAPAYGEKVLIACGVRGTLVERLTYILEGLGIAWHIFAVQGEPSVAMVLQGVADARASACEWVIGFGGGSALDLGKAVSAFLTNPGDPLQYLEVVGQNQPLLRVPAPYVAIPTTAGTGSEVTRNAVLAVPEQGVKVSLRSALLLPRLALVDPELTYSMPPALTAATGMDALTQVIEPYVSKRANPMTDRFCEDGIQRVVRALPRAYAHSADHQAREEMAYASLMGGLALANAGLGAVHGLAGPIGGMVSAPHGAVCAALLPAVVQVNTQALMARQPTAPALARYQQVAQWVLSDASATFADLVRWLEGLRDSLHITGLRSYGISMSQRNTLIEKSLAASSMKSNPLELTSGEIARIMDLAW